ncbi:MAG: hypothetical protein SLRJCFUN_000566 [Candidatus Fervidibacter sp.]
MTCQQVRSHLSEYWSGELPSEFRQAIAIHLQGCPACQQEWGKFCEAMRNLRSLTAPEPPADLPQRISAAIRSRHRLALRRRWLWASVPLFGAALLLTLALFLPFHWRHRERLEVALAPSAAPSLPLPPVARPPSPPALSVPKETPTEEVPTPQKSAPERKAKTFAKETMVEGFRRSDFERRAPSIPLKDLKPQRAPIPSLPSTPSPAPRQAPLLAEAPKPTAPTASAELENPKETPQISSLPLMMRRIPTQAGGAQQAFLTLEANLQVRWERFELPSLNEVALWRIRLTPPIPCHLTLSVQPNETVEVPNAVPEGSPERGWLLGEGNASPQKPLTLPLLVRPKQTPLLRLPLLVAWDGQVSRWVILSAVSERAAFSDPNVSVTIEQDRWRLHDLLTYLARQMQGAFLLPEGMLEQTVTIPTGRRTCREILSAVEKWLGRRWQQVGTAFALTTSKGEE